MTRSSVVILGIVVLVIAGTFWYMRLGSRIRTLEGARADFARQHPSAQVRVDSRSGFATTISDLEASTASTTAVNNASSGRFAMEFVQDPAVATVLGLQAERAQLREVGRFSDPQRANYNVIRIQQFVQQVRVYGAEILVSVRNGQTGAIGSITTRAATVPSLDLTPSVDQATAQATAAELYATVARDPRSNLPATAPVTETELVLFDPQRFQLPGEATLAWRVRVASVELFIDARTRRLVTAYDNRHSVLNRLTHDCRNSAACKLVLNETGPTPPGTVPLPDAAEGHKAARFAHDYFLSAFGRDGFDDSTATGGVLPIESYVQVADLNNAQWVPALRRLEYAAGWMTRDIAGHEYTHAVTQFGPGLLYLGESGAVNEFFSDFFGALIEAAGTGKQEWLIGEGVKGFSASHPLRNMASPHNAGFDKTKDWDPKTNDGQPEQFSELVTVTDRICSSTFLQDNGCVHFNGGILSKAATLASDGGTFRGVTVTGIAPRKLEQVLFRTLMLGGVTASSGLKDTADGAVLMCNQLVGVGTFGITAADCTAVGQAFTAVGLR
jgi:Zn-dependent metalloprotease